MSNVLSQLVNFRTTVRAEDLSSTSGNINLSMSCPEIKFLATFYLP
jgi:hypothetical protein